MKSRYMWFEVWADIGMAPPYILILLSKEGEKSFDIFDPKEEKIEYSSSVYEKARNWLREDEYVPIGDREYYSEE